VWIYINTVLGIILFSGNIIALLQTIATKSNTLTTRLNIYQYAWYYLKTHYLELLVGYDYRVVGNLVIGFLLAAKTPNIIRGFENGLLDMVFVYGISGFLLFLGIVTIAIMILWNNVYGKLLSILFILYVIFVNMTLSHIFQPYVIPIITLLLVIISRDTAMKQNDINKSGNDR
jgi:hypothetical protein